MTVMDLFESVVGKDEEAGCFLMDAVAYDLMSDVAKEFEPELREMYSLWALDRVQVAKRALGRRYVADVADGEYPGLEMSKAAGWLAGIERFVVAASGEQDVSKAFSYETFDRDGKRVQVGVNRDSGGRFARGVNQNRSTKLRDVAGSPDRISPTLKGYFDGNYVPFDNLDDGDRKSAERHQGQWDQVQSIVGGFARDFKGAENAVDVRMEVQDNETGDIRVVGFPLSRFKQKDGQSPANAMPDLKDLKPLTNESIRSVSLEPNRYASSKDVARLATYNSLGSIGGQALASLANTSEPRLGALKDSLRMPGSGANAPKEGLGRLFGLFNAGGQVLQESLGSNKITEMAQLVGTLGPQAEEVLSPYVRQAAYRYRGTEVKPAPALNPATIDPELRRNLEFTANSNRETVPTGLTGDSLEMQAIADNASIYLATTLPKDPLLARLSEESGQVLPSRGVIYDASGRPVTEAVGFTDDHYLPFDLKNMASLRGGQYVRTRVTGGLTGEDVYAAVMTGARQVQVVSESGVFTLDFQPDFRGARANSDKARSMYDRYLKILDAVDSSGLYLQDLPAQKVREIKQKVREQAKYGGDATVIEAELRREAYEELDDLDDKEIGRIAAIAYRQATRRDVPEGEALAAGEALRGREAVAFSESFEEAEEVARSAKVNKLRLNGQGYAAALATLQAQFPQFIRRTERRPLSALGREAGRDMPRTRQYAQDRGYVSPGGLRADRVRSGFSRSGNITPPSKASANASERNVSAPEKDSKASPDTSDAAKTPVEGATGVSDKTPAVGAKARLIDRQKRFAADFDSGIKSLASDLSLMTDSISVDVLERYQGTDFTAMEGSKRKVLWLLTNMGKETADAMRSPKTRAAAIAALSDEDAVQDAIDQVFKESDASAGGFVSIGGKEVALDEAAEAISAKAAKLTDLAYLSEPYSPMLPAPDQPFHSGISPMEFPDIAAIGDAAQLEAYTAKNPDVAANAKTLAKDGFGKMAATASSRAKAMKKVDEARKAAAAKGFKGTNPIDYVDGKDFAKAFPGVELTMSSLRAADPQKAGLDLQRAWSLAVTAKLLEGLGDDLPKAGAAGRPLSKAAPRILILPPDAPLSKAVAARVSKGLPPLPGMASTGRR